MNIPKDEIETIIIKRIKHYLAHSETVHRLLETTLRNKHSVAPMIEEQIRQIKIKIGNVRRAVGGFSDAIQSAVLDKTQNLTEVCKVLIDEKTKAQETIDKLDVEIRELEYKKIVVRDKFENSTLPDFLQKVVKHFDKMSDVEKRKIIQTIIPRIVIHPEDPHKIELFVNPDPNSKIPHSLDLTVGQNVLISHNWLGN